jgi:hypothetical protein
MRNLILLSLAFIAFGFTAATSQQGRVTCDVEDAKLKCKKELVPYRYTNMSVQRIFFRRYNQKKTFSFPLMFDTKHRFVFNTENLPQEVKIKAFSDNEFVKKRDELGTWSSNDKQWFFEPDPAQPIPNVYFEFYIPASIAEDTRTIPKGCIVIMVGYEDEYAGFEGESTSGVD